jgi:GT2 family glycosyltransferase
MVFLQRTDAVAVVSTSLPKVSVLVLNLDDGQNLRACRSSLEKQVYPRDRFQIDVVDAGSRGLGAACNDAIRRCDGDFVALLSSDARVDPRWLSELVSAADRHHASAVASTILDWTGKTIDFAGGRVAFTGHMSPVAAGEAATRAMAEERLLFACSRSALFGRAAFLEAGGFDETFFDGLEDVDLGWRLNVLGHTIVLAPQALTYRRGQGALGPGGVQAGRSSLWAPTRRLRLLERNALAMIYKNYEAATLERVLPVAIALSLLRGLTGSGIDTLSLEMSARPLDVVAASPKLVAHLIALEDFGRQVPDLKLKREIIEQRRRRSDAELSGLFGDPLRLDEVDGPSLEVARALIHDFGIDEIFGGSHRGPVTRAAVEDGRPALAPEETAPGLPAPLPKVSIVILTALGATHLPECLASLREQTYPPDRVEVIIVDNGSADDPTAAAERCYPGARTIRNRTNIGFAAGNNVGAAAATGDYLVFLNDDTRVRPDWLLELVETARRRGAPAVASCILDWSGRKNDFVGGAVNFQGKGFQLDYDAPADSLALEEKPLLFACGCAMLIDRAVFMDAGQWDEGTFAYYEDVELGWRLNLLGHAIWFAPGAVVYHKHHGTSGRWPEPPRIRLYERNSLRMVYELLELPSLARVLPATLLLAADRALLSTALSRATDVPPASTGGGDPHRLAPRRIVHATKAAFRSRGVTKKTPVGQALARLGIRGFLGVAREVFFPRRVTRTPERRAAYLIEHGAMPASFDELQSESLPIEAAAMLSGIYGFLADLPALTRRRADAQRRRRATDLEIVRRFGSHWGHPCPARYQHEHNALHAMLIDEFALTELDSTATTVTAEHSNT